MSSASDTPEARNILVRLGALVGGVLMFCLVCITFIDVIGRQIGHPLSFAFEFTQVTVGMMFYLTLPLVTLRREHIVVDFLPFREGSVADLASEIFASLVSVGILAMVTLQLWQQGNTLQTYNTVMMFTRMPVAPFVYFMSVMAAVTTLVLVGLLYLSLRRLLGVIRGGR